MRKTPIYLIIGALCLLFQSAYANLLLEDGFNYPTGSLGGATPANGPWTGGSANILVTSPSLTYSGLADTANPGNAVTVTAAAGGTTKANFTGTAVTSGSIFYSFLAECTLLPTANNYLTALDASGGAPGGSSDPLSVYVGQSVAGSAFRIGVRHQGNGSGATYTTNNTSFVLNKVNLFVVEYTFNPATGDDAVSLFVNPTPGGNQPVADVTVSGGTDAANLQVVGLKANSGNTAGTWIFDTVRIGDSWADVMPAATPEPSTCALAGLALAGLAVWRRARR